MGLAACSSDGETTAGSPFTQALSKNYNDLAGQASALPGERVERSFWDSLNPFSNNDTSSGLLTNTFSAKAELADEGTEPEPETAVGPLQASLRSRLVRALAAGKDQFPQQAARAQTDYDCWVAFEKAHATATSQACQAALTSSIAELENSARPAPPPSAESTPAPTAGPPRAPAATAATSIFTIYFDFDSWTLKAEQLKVLDDVISTARAAGQSNISIVGHTDTSGSPDYNQKLSEKRANIVVEVLVKMGARRAAVHASGVGETDLAVETGDGVKEAKNRRTVVTMQP